MVSATYIGLIYITDRLVSAWSMWTVLKSGIVFSFTKSPHPRPLSLPGARPHAFGSPSSPCVAHVSFGGRGVKGPHPPTPSPNSGRRGDSISYSPLPQRGGGVRGGGCEGG